MSREKWRFYLNGLAQMFVYRTERKSCITKCAILCIGNLFVKREVQQNFLTALLVEHGHVCTNIILCGPSIVCY